ncbi:short transient receptor potential channel 7-like isoform X2 [Styela clava]
MSKRKNVFRDEYGKEFKVKRSLEEQREKSPMLTTIKEDCQTKSPGDGSRWRQLSNIFQGTTKGDPVNKLLGPNELFERIAKYWPRSRRGGARGTRGTTGIFSTRDPPTEEEVKFLEAAEYGNIPTVRKMLEESTTFSVNCVDFMGQNALQLAVGNEHLEVVELLLKQPVMARIGDGLLLAISKGYVRIAEIILNHPSFQVHDRLTRSPCEQRLMNQDTDFYAYDEDGTRFSPDITPIILASQCQEYEIVHELLMRGARIERPHNYRCTCEECSFRKKLDSFSYSLSRINAYKGLASPAYLSLSSSDPVLTALELSHELQQLAEIEKEFKKDYHDLAAQCDDFAERLLDLCHDTEEVEVILNGKDSSTDKVCDTSGQSDEMSSNFQPYEPSLASVSERADSVATSYDSNANHNNSNTSAPNYHTNSTARSPAMPQLKRLKTAIRYSVKGFVAHPNCQQQLLRLWQRNLSWLWQSPSYFKILFAGGVTLFMPVLACIYIFAPCTKAATLIKSPFCKFISHAMSYFQFLCLLVVNSSDRFEGGLIPSWFLVHQTKPFGRFTTFTWCEVLIMLYILGFLWNECHEVFDEGPREYMFKLWNIIDFFMLSIFLASYALRAISYYRVSTAQDWWDDEYGENATLITYENKSLYMGNKLLNRSIPDVIGYYAYGNAERKHWIGSDPQLLSEALFSFGIVLSFSRIAYLLPANEMFGPLQISLGRTVADIMKWIVIFFMIFGAFLLGLFNLYSYYAMEGAKSSKSFTTLEETFITLFWSMFGLADYKGVEVNYPHPFTRLVGYQLYGVYNIISVIIMLNMLIAMINSSYSDVEKDADVEWKFARAKLWLSYFDDGKTLPVPYNIIPSPKSVGVLIVRINRLFKKLYSCKLMGKNRRAESNNGHTSSSFSRAGKKRSLGTIRESVSMSSFGVSAKINKKQNGLRRSESETSKTFRGLSFKQKTEQLTRYQVIMRRIVKRFVIRAQVEKDRDEVNEGELQEIKHDISSLRFELLENTATYAEQINQIRILLESSPIIRHPQQHHVTQKQEQQQSSANSTSSVTTKLIEQVIKSSCSVTSPNTEQTNLQWRRPMSASGYFSTPLATTSTGLSYKRCTGKSETEIPATKSSIGYTESWHTPSATFDAQPTSQDSEVNKRRRRSAYVRAATRPAPHSTVQQSTSNPGL